MRHDPTARRPQRAAQPRPNLADQLERITPRLDALTQRARLGVRDAADLHDLEELAQGIAHDVVAPFRGASAAPTCPPRYVSADGLKAAW